MLNMLCYVIVFNLNITHSRGKDIVGGTTVVTVWRRLSPPQPLGSCAPGGRRLRYANYASILPTACVGAARHGTPLQGWGKCSAQCTATDRDAGVRNEANMAAADRGGSFDWDARTTPLTVQSKRLRGRHARHTTVLRWVAYPALLRR